MRTLLPPRAHPVTLGPLRASLVLLALAATAAVPAQSARQILERMASPEFRSLRGTLRLEQQTGPPAAAAASPELGTVTLFDVVLARPNRLHVAVTSPTGLGDGLAQCDGARLLLASTLLGQVAEGEAPASWRGVGRDNLALIGAGASVIVPTLLGLPLPMIEAVTAPGAAEARTLPPQRVAGAPCDVVEAVSTGGSGIRSARTSGEEGAALTTVRWAIDAQGIPRRFELLMHSQDPALAVRLVEEFLILEVDGEVTDADFAAPPPEGLTPVPQLDPTHPLSPPPGNVNREQ